MRSPQASLRRVCPSCAGNVLSPLSRYRHAHLVKCRRCGLVFASSVPSPTDLAEHYAKYPASGQLSRLTARRYDELLARLEAFRKTGRLLDIGCGDGHFLAVAKRHGWRVYGSEYGEAPRGRAQSLGLDVRPAPFQATGGEMGSFDVVTAIEVLEHVAQPLEEAERMKVLLRAGGGLYLTTPNFGSLSRLIAGPRWRAIEYPEHLNLFTPRTLDSLLTKAGLRRLSVATTGISPSDIRAGVHSSNSSGSQANPAPSIDQRLRARTESSRAMEAALKMANAALSPSGLGDTIKVLYVRP